MESPSIEQLLQLGCEEVLDVLKSDRLGADANLALLAEAAASSAVKEVALEVKVCWALVALLSAEQGMTAGQIDRDMGERMRMMLRAKLVAQLGMVQDVGVLDISVVIDWLVSRISEVDPAVLLSQDSYSIDDVRLLRCLKNDLSVAAPIIDDPNLASVPGMRVIKYWWDRRGSLP